MAYVRKTQGSFAGQIIKLCGDLKSWVWDKLFLDFYLDKRWTLEFKILNMISRDFLRGVLTELYYHLEKMPDDDLHTRRAKFWVNAAWQAWRK